MPHRKGYRITADYASKDVFNHYVKESGNPGKINQRTFNKIVGEFNTAVLDLIILEHYRFMFPRRLGYLRVKKKKIKLYIDKDGNLDPRYLRVDYKATKELWAKDPSAKEKHQKVYHTNSHTDGYNLQWYWDKTISTAKNVRSFTFDVVRDAKRRLAAACQDPMLKIDFFE